MSENLPTLPPISPEKPIVGSEFEWLSEDTLEALESLSQNQVTSVVERLLELLRFQESRFRSMMEIGLAMSSIFELDELLTVVMSKITELMQAERSTLFLVDETTGELWSKVSQGVINTEIRVRMGEGIAGWVAATGQAMNIKDAYQEPRFNSNYDAQSGFRTRNMLCQPIRNQKGMIIGVVQVLNSSNPEFTTEDEYVLSALSSQAAIALENSKLYASVVSQNQELVATTRQLEKKVEELDLLYELEQKIADVKDLESMIARVTASTAAVLDAHAAALVLRQDDHLLYFVHTRQADGEWKLCTRRESIGNGVSDMVMRTNAPFLCNSGTCEPVPGVSRNLGFEVTSVVAIPLQDEDQKVIGAMKVLNRNTPFGVDDLKLLTLIGGRIADVLVRRKQQDELEKSARLATIGQMLSGVIHDLKNPIAIINGYVQLMVRADDRAKRDGFASIISRQFDHLNQMTQELLNFARGEANLQVRDVHVPQLLEEVESLLANELARRNVALIIHCHYEGQARLDDGKIKRVILNLGRNAADAMPNGGRFVVDVWVDEAKDELVMSFSDTGKGIPEAVRETLFEPFVTRGKDHGTGLGLAIVKQIVDVHHGTISFESTLNEGTTFTIRIPRMAAAWHSSGVSE
jgi:signal transduction histidine kinase/putative methionine-R-sulfoxide reductase with GAF domain